MTTLREALREATADDHATLDESGAVMRALRAPGGYERSLTLLLRLHRRFEVENAVREYWRPCGFAFERRLKTPLLEADLRKIGVADAGGPDGTAGPDFRDDAFGPVGALYVLEGATLGGRFIHRLLRDELGLESRYYASYGEERGRMWREFETALGRFEERHPSARPAVLEGARAMFAAFRDAFPI